MTWQDQFQILSYSDLRAMKMTRVGKRKRKRKGERYM